MSGQDLNLQQLQAVQATEGPVLVIAGAGSGKTRVIVHRIIHLLNKGVDSEKILAITFTNKAAAEMRIRVEKATNAHVLVCTFHKFGLHILRECIHKLGYDSDFTIFDQEESAKLIKAAAGALQMKLTSSELKEFRRQISQRKNQLILPDEKGSDLPDRLYAEYQRQLKLASAVDFDDLLLLPVILFRQFPDSLLSFQNRYSYLHIDEYQDTNHAQYVLASCIAEKHKNLCAVGDPDQSIYSWRGADMNKILQFSEEYPDASIITLDCNYRSCSTILKAANALIRNNGSRFSKDLWCDRVSDRLPRIAATPNEREEARYVVSQIQSYLQSGIPMHEVAVFYRTNAQSRLFEEELMQEEIPYVLIGAVSFYQRKEIKDVLAFLKMAIKKGDPISFMRTIPLAACGIGAKTIENLLRDAGSNSLRDYLADPKLTKLTSRQKNALAAYCNLLQKIENKVLQESIPSALAVILQDSGYLALLGKDEHTYADRVENLNALITKAMEWCQDNGAHEVHRFLDDLSINQEMQEGYQTSKVHLMTLHHSKGLEFSAVFLTGLEEALLPHIISLNEGDIEEERRLCYVGVTRAKEFLTFTYCQKRMVWGAMRQMRRSRFLEELSLTAERETFCINYEDEPKECIQQEPFQIGETVIHRDFGRGVIEEMSDGSMGPIFRIYFPLRDESKRVIAQYAPLRR